MKYGNCPVCGKLYAKSPAGMCPECFAKQEEDERIVAEYIRDHRRCSVQEVHVATGVSEKVIYHMIKSGRVTECKDIEYPCEKCGRLISAGRLCKSCMQDFIAEAEKVTSDIKTKLHEGKNTQSHGMYSMYSKDIEH